MTLTGILDLINALAPLVAPAIVNIDHVYGAMKGAGIQTDTASDDDLRALIDAALVAKAEADRAAAGDDPR